MSHAPFESEFAHTVFKGKYPFTPEEEWDECGRRVVHQVFIGLHNAPRGHRLMTDLRVRDAVTADVQQRLFIPGGRYLYGSGRPFHQVNNCLLLRAEDTREGWADLKHKSMMALMTGAGIGVYYGDVRESMAPIARTGGVSSGPVALMRSVNEDGRAAVQGGDRRSAIWAGLPWWHKDVMAFIEAKDWPEWLREQKAKDWTVPAPMDMTNISVCLDQEFFDAYGDEQHPMHDRAHQVYWRAITKMTTTGEPGFSVDLGDRSDEVLRNAPVTGDTHVLTDVGYQPVIELIGKPTTVWTGKQWADDVVFKQTAKNTDVVAVQMTGGRTIRCDPTHEFLVEVWVGAGKRRHLDRIERVAAKDLQPGQQLHVSLGMKVASQRSDTADMYTLGYLYGDGSFCGKRAEVTLCTEESKACLMRFSPTLSKKVNLCDGRGYTRVYFRSDPWFESRSKREFPTELYSVAPDQQAAFVAGLFDADGNWEATQKRLRLSSKHEGFLRCVGRLLEQLGILAHVSKAGNSTYGQKQTYQLVVAAEFNRQFAELIPTERLRPNLISYAAYRKAGIKVLDVAADGLADVFCADVRTPEHSFQAEGVIVSNCTEITSADDSDVCNLGSLVLPRFENPKAFGEAVRNAALFLTAGSLYSDVSYPKVAQIREQNRRLGLGLIGVHEFCLIHGVKYGTDASFEALEPFLKEYDRALEYAWDWQDRLGISRSVAATAIAPNGTIGILAESTPSGDPMFSAARLRIVITASPAGDVHTEHVVVDPVAKRLVEQGVDPNDIEDAYSLALYPERRLAMQAYLQSHVDQAVSSTINLPYVMEDPQERSEFGRTLIKFLPKLRGVTAYPDGARAGQPLKPVDLKWALEHEGQTRIEGVEATCHDGICGV